MKTICRMLSLVTLFACAGMCVAHDVTSKEAQERLRPFGDGRKHYRDATGLEDYRQFPPEDVTAIADNLLLYQRSNGGWPKNFDPRRILSDAERTELLENREKKDTTFDNRATYVPTEYLAWAYQVTEADRFREASERGLELILQAQYENGGWPHTWPNTKGYYGHITIVDDVLSGILITLGKAARKRDPFGWLPDSLAARCREAEQRGLLCLLDLQIQRGDRLLGWASQYDAKTLEPAQGRSFEPPALTSAETVGVLRYLMKIEDPTPEVCRSIEAAAAWLEEVKIEGLRIETVSAKTERYQHHSSSNDRIAIVDPSAPPIWGRFYEIDTMRPVMANRDGVKVYRLEEVSRERRTGYAWYGSWPRNLLAKEYPDWKARQGRMQR